MFPDDNDGPEFETYRAAVVQLLRDDGYEATTAIRLVRRFHKAIRSAWTTGQDLGVLARVILVLADEPAEADRTPIHQPD